MIVSITKRDPRNKDRRERWTFRLGPPDDKSLTFILDEYAIELWDEPTGKWRRPKNQFYRRYGNGPRDDEAHLTLEMVPRMSDEVREMLHQRIIQQSSFVSQSDAGIQRV